MKTNSTSYLLSSTSINSLVDEINYRNMQILSRIKQCDSDMKFNDICKIYSIDNNTNSLKHPSKIVFYTFEDLVHTLVNLIIVQRLKKFCLSINWCLENLVLNDIVYTNEVLKYYGRSFCTLEQCHSRLSLFIDSCPIHFFSNKNISIPTLKLLPILCTLYKEHSSWGAFPCMKQIVYLLHILYAFWPQIERCYDDFSAGFNVCTLECQTFDNMLNIVENRCRDNASFLSRVPALAWYRSINLTKICHQKSLSTRLLSTSSVFIIIVIFLVISFSLWFYLKSRYRLNSNNRRLNNNYKHTRLNNLSFEPRNKDRFDNK